MAVASVGPTITEMVEAMPNLNVSISSQPDVLMLLGSERMPFFEYVYGATGFEDRLDHYGFARERIYEEGEHFDIVTRCSSNRVLEFTSALEDFLSHKCDESDTI